MSNPTEFLARLRSNGLAFGQYVWDGEHQETLTSITFEWSNKEPAEVVNRRALEFFSSLTDYDWINYRIEVDVRHHRLVRAILKPRASLAPVKVPGSTARLRQLAAIAEGRKGN